MKIEQSKSFLFKREVDDFIKSPEFLSIISSAMLTDFVCPKEKSNIWDVETAICSEIMFCSLNGILMMNILQYHDYFSLQK